MSRVNLRRGLGWRSLRPLGMWPIDRLVCGRYFYWRDAADRNRHVLAES
jgi:hypothetical protein